MNVMDPHPITKITSTIPLLSGPIMLAAGLGKMKCPPMLCNAQQGKGIDKLAWAAELSGIPRETIMIILGVCKLLALLDVWLLHIMPRVTLLCVSVMMGCVLYGHLEFDDEIKPIVVFLTASLFCAMTWPKVRRSEMKKKA